ncbi:MAG: 5'-nucleotidase C-terminal domain-containing protein [Thermoplasmata archaeon]|nr:5'-nucleotidase C-terminal domain-containing protein [Thermoplasmata archaeon]MCI4337431.1 5'-nucleotidase C-terminal domain-containing protein [Thermoplasmata archaeon]
MSPGRFTAWSIRWVPHFCAFVAVTQLANLLADAFLWHVDAAALVAGGVLTVLFAGVSAAGFWSRRAKVSIRSPSPA